MRLWRKKIRQIEVKTLNQGRIPQHVAIIMDGNGRWAEQKGMPRAMGHRAGVEALKDVVRCCDRIGIKYLTVYAFSTENWKRPQTEIGILMSLLKEYVLLELDELYANNVKIRFLGIEAQLPADVVEAYRLACAKTENNTGLVLNVALNYGGRAELLLAIKKIVQDVENGLMSTEEITEQNLEKYLFTAGCPDPELVIRTSGEMRLSNFLLWQAAYSEIVIVDENWPDFNDKSLIETIRIYQQRERRFGGIKKDEE